ncbi:MAG TPA: putative motility protein [Clostridia bacterium]|nr:putative motility protein [Clostridia bacterium]
MEINNSMQQSISSIHQAIGIATLKKSLSQDTQSMAALLQGFQNTNAKIMENSVTPYKGGTIDIRV